jgi:hypothetical protein
MKNCILLLVLLSLPLGIAAQKTDKGTIRGNVYDKETAQPLAFATVQVEGAGVGSATDINGFFSIADIPIGQYRLKVTYLGYEDFSTDIKISKGEIVYKTAYLQESGTSLGEVVISGRKEQARSEVQVSKLTVTPKQIRSLPSHRRPGRYRAVPDGAAGGDLHG